MAMDRDRAPAARPCRGRCLPPDQRVLTRAGYRSVEAIDVRDTVITAHGRPRLVTRVFSRESSEPLYHVRTARGNVLRVTGEHPVLSRSADGTPRWVPASRLGPKDVVGVYGAVSRGPWTAGGPSVESIGGGVGLLVRAERVAGADLDWAPIASVEATPYQGLVYDLDVEEDHTFISEGVVCSACAQG